MLRKLLRVKYVTELTALEYSLTESGSDGTSYLIKTDIGDDTDFVYIKVYVPPPQSEAETDAVLRDVLFKPELIDYY